MPERTTKHLLWTPFRVVQRVRMVWKRRIADVCRRTEPGSQQQGDQQAGDKASHMGKIGHAAHALLCLRERGHTIEELEQEPEADQNNRREGDDGEKDEDKNDGAHACQREEHQVGRQNARNSTAGAEAGDRGARVHRDWYHSIPPFLRLVVSTSSLPKLQRTRKQSKTWIQASGCKKRSELQQWSSLLSPQAAGSR